MVGNIDMQEPDLVFPTLEEALHTPLSVSMSLSHAYGGLGRQACLAVSKCTVMHKPILCCDKPLISTGSSSGLVADTLSLIHT